MGPLPSSSCWNSDCPSVCSSLLVLASIFQQAFALLHCIRFVSFRLDQLNAHHVQALHRALPGTPKRPLFVKSSRNLALSRKLSLSRTETLAAAVASASSATLRKAMRRTPSRP